MKSTVSVKLLALVVMLSIVEVNSFAQVRIGVDTDPDEHAVLDLRATDLLTDEDGKGVLFPRVELENYTDLSGFGNPENITEGMTVFNNASGEGKLPKGLYVWSSGEDVSLKRWFSTNASAGSWFYMPPTNIDTDYDPDIVSNNHKFLDLFNEFQMEISNTIKNPSAPEVDTPIDVGLRTQYYYYVTNYDPATFDNILINDNGEMTYDIIAEPTDATFINIIFVRK